MSTPYTHTEVVHNFSAATQVVPLVMQIVNPASVLDVGCGIGTWLKVFQEHGVNDFVGVDGNFVDRRMLKISQERFHAHDLTTPVALGRKFDLVVSLEVAEHIPEQFADSFVEMLVKHGDVHLFSAAIPGQGGQNHVNEQWPEYWQKKFEPFGFYFHDVIRPQIWGNEQVDFWYRQNMFLVKREKPLQTPFHSLSVVHPELLNLKIGNEKEYFQSLIDGKQGIRLGFTIFLNTLKFKFKNLLGFK